MLLLICRGAAIGEGILLSRRRPGQALAKLPGALEHPFYGEWVQSYAGEEYAAMNQGLIDLMNQLAENVTDEQLEHLKEIFVNCSRYELGFWDMAWEMRK